MMSGETRALPTTGDTVAEKYRLIRVVGEGGMGIVYEAEHVGLNQRVALKMLKADRAEQLDAVLRFEREARAVAKLRGPNVAHVSDVDRLDDGTPYIVMEYLDGCDLGDELSDRGRLPVDEAVDYLVQACLAMTEAHRCQIVHRDLKPSNLFLCTRNGKRTLKVLDFGISKLTVEDDSSVTQTHLSLGTPLYMSPEQIRSSKRVDERTDVWALGVILYELLAGIPPFQAEGATAVIAAITADEPKPLREHRPDVPEQLERVVMKALEKDVDKRFATTDAFAEALLPFASNDESMPPSSRRSSENEVSMLRLRALADKTTLKERNTPGWTSSTLRRGGRRSRLARGLLAAAGVSLLAAAVWSVLGNATPAPSPGEPAGSRALSQPTRALSLDSATPATGEAAATAPAPREEPLAGERHEATTSERRIATLPPAQAPKVTESLASKSRHAAPKPSTTAPTRAIPPRAAKPNTVSEPQPRPPARSTPPTQSPGRNPLHL